MVRRLLDYVNDKEENIIEGLIDIGMDPDSGRIEGDCGWHLPGPYISELRNDVDFHQREAQEWEEKYEDMKAERDRLKSRSVADLMSNMQELIKRAEAQAREADRIATQLKARNKDLEDKINVWTVMES
jgi:predicted small metal-binding protein